LISTGKNGYGAAQKFSLVAEKAGALQQLRFLWSIAESESTGVFAKHWLDEVLSFVQASDTHPIAPGTHS
jgi:hypothetical protein